MEKINKNEMAQTIVAADFRLSLASIHAGMDNKFSEVAREVRKVSRRPLSQVEAEYRDACASMKKQNAGDCKTCNIAPNSERVAESKARAEKDEKAQQDNAPAHIKALREAIAWWNERVTSPIKEDVPFTERKNHETPCWYDLAVSEVRSYEAGAVSPERAEELNELAAMRTEFDRQECAIADLEARVKSLSFAANSHASTLAAESRQHEETRQKLQEALARLEPLREAASTLLHGVTRRDEELDGLKERAEAAELRIRKVAEALGLPPEQAVKIATGK